MGNLFRENYRLNRQIWQLKTRKDKKQAGLEILAQIKHLLDIQIEMQQRSQNGRLS